MINILEKYNLLNGPILLIKENIVIPTHTDMWK